MWILLIAILGSSYQVDFSSIVLFYSDNTPPNLLSEFSQFTNRIKLANNSSTKITLKQNSVFIDLTLNPGYLPILDVIAKDSQAIYLTLCEQVSGFFSKHRIHALNDQIIELQALTKMIKYLNFTEFILMSSSNYLSLKLSRLVHENHKEKIFQSLVYGEKISQSVGVELIQKMVKNTGISKILIVGEDTNLQVIQQAIIQKRINDAGAVFLFTSSATGSVIIDGSLVICEQGTESSTSHSNYYLNLILNKLIQITPSQTSSSVPSSSYSIINLQSGTWKTIGSISQNLAITSQILYPGNITSLSEINLKQVTFLIANNTNEIYNLYPYYLFSYFYNGAIYAINELNLLQEIPRFNFNLREFDVGLFYYDETWYKMKLSQALTYPYPIAVLTNFWPTAAIGTSMALSSLNVNLPQISPFASDSRAESSENLPFLLKLTVSQAELLSNGINFIMSFGWKTIVLIGTDDGVFYPYYLAVLELCKARGISIANPENNRILPSNYTRTDFDKYRSFFQTIKDTKCRIFLMFAWDRGFIWEALYDIGLRKGDFIAISDSATMGYLENLEEQYLVKRKELAKGTFSLLYKEWNGELGHSLHEKFKLIFPSLDYLCMCYDTVTVVKEAIKFMLNVGEDYEDGQKLMNRMRGNKVVGCMGNVYFKQSSTSMSNGKFKVQQLLESNSTLYQKDIAVLDKLSTQFIYYINEPTWITSTTPTNFIPNFDCPFEERQIESSNKGSGVLYGLCTFFFISACGFSYLSYAKFKSTYSDLTEKRIMSLSDRAFYLFFVIQVVQILVMGPDQLALKSISNNFGALISLDFDKYYNLSHNDFWILFYSVFGFAVFWVLVNLVVVLELDITYQEWWICEKISALCDFIFPIIGNIGFLPILSMLMNLYLCTDSIGSSLTDTFMDKDCYVYCYEGKHKALASVTGVLIFFHIALGIYSKPLWETTQYSLAIRTRPSYLSILSLFQVVLVIFNKTVKIYSQFVHGCLCSILTLVLLIYTIIAKPYNHKPTYILQIASLSISIWGLFNATLFIYISNLTVWTITELIGILIMLLLSIIIFAKTPNLLFNPQGNDISSLFIFQFCKNYQRYARDMRSLHFTVEYKYRTQTNQIRSESNQCENN